MCLKLILVSIVLPILVPLCQGQVFDKDLIKTSRGTLEITFIGHSSLMFLENGFIIYLDPSRNAADYGSLPKADLILITHHHSDHCDPIAISEISKEDTKILVTGKGHEILKKGMIVKNNQSLKIKDLRIDVVPAYNVVHKTSKGKHYHPKGEGNGYILTVGDTRIYVAGDTENIEEMSSLRNIDIAFLPMNLPSTMTPEMVVAGVNLFKPDILYPYHHRGANLLKLMELMEAEKQTELRIRRMY